MAKEIDLTQYRNLLTVGKAKESGDRKVEIEVNRPTSAKEGEEIAVSRSGDLKQENEILYKKEETTHDPSYKDIYDEENLKKVPFNEATKVTVTESEAETKTASPEISSLVEKYNEVNREQETTTPEEASVTTPKEGVEVYLDRKFEIKYKKLYLEISPVHTRRLKKSAMHTADEIKTTWDDVENRRSDPTSELTIFLYNLFPYMGTNVLQTAAAAINDPPRGGAASLLAILGLSFGILGMLQKLKYFTLFELVMFFGSNFYTLHFVRGISVKKYFGLFGPEDFVGGPDIRFGRAMGLESFGEIMGKFLNLFQPGGLQLGDPNDELVQAKGRFSPEISRISQDIFRVWKQSSKNVDTLDPLNIRWPEYFWSIVKQQENIEAGTKWAKQTIKSYVFYNLQDRFSSLATPPLDLNILSFYSTARMIEFKEAVKAGTKWGKDLSRSKKILPSYAERRVGPIINVGEEREADLINPDVLNIYLLSDKRISRGNDEELGSPTVKKPEEWLKDKSFLQKEGKWQIGAIYVMPIYETEGEFKPFYIPFEFNPSIDEGSLTAKYQATEYLARIGSPQTFTGVNSFTVSINTKYYAVSHGPDNQDTDGHSWMHYFTLQRIQAMELAFRSLVLPTFPEEEDIEGGYKYIKPPLVKVIMGNPTDADDPTPPYATLLTYAGQGNLVMENKLQSTTEKRVHRTFIVTDVTIKKDLMETPLYLDEEKMLRDTFGFDLSLSLTEVTPSYMDTYPDFRSYHKAYVSYYNVGKEQLQG